MHDFHCLDPAALERFLDRRRSARSFPIDFNLAESLVEILRKANQFVPSAAGSILLDDPYAKREDRELNPLTFIASFGDQAESLVGKQLHGDLGIAGHVYREGRTYVTSHAHGDRYFYPGFDEQTSYVTRSLIAVPISIEQNVCGVMELINRADAEGFSQHDQNLLEIFADYISISIQTVLDGRQAQEIAKRDNLTGLFNDRYLHIVLAQEIERCLDESLDLAVLFLDLDFFKRVNDTHGHLAGSQVLREVGSLLRKKILGTPGLAARYGGDEFVLVIPEMSLDGAVDLAEDIRTEILTTTFCSEPGEIHPEPLELRSQTCSIGVATLRQHIAEQAEGERVKSTLLRLADAAMYVAKETGRNRTAVAGSPVRRRQESVRS